jgi:exonuclease III
MKIATWNVNSLPVRLPRLLAWLPVAAPDVLCLQETKIDDPRFPHEEIAAAGYVAHFSGQRTYNGVALLVKNGLPAPVDVVTALPGFADEQRRVIAATTARVAAGEWTSCTSASPKTTRTSSRCSRSGSRAEGTRARASRPRPASSTG